MVLALRHDPYPLRVDACADQVFARGRRPFSGQIQIGVFPAGRVGVAELWEITKRPQTFLNWCPLASLRL